MSSSDSPLKIVHISTWDNAGGSGRAAYRLHTSLKKLGVQSRMLVGRKRTLDPDVRVIGGAFHRLDKLIGGLSDRMDLQYLFYPSSFFLPWMRWVRQADLIQVFNTHGGYFGHRAFVRLSRRRPVVWRLSDMWALTGHCSYSYECERWRTGCGSCPHLEEYPQLRRDTSAALWRVKDQIYRKSRLTIVSPSRWLGELARQSPLLSRFPIHWIPNGLDTDLFHPIPKEEARRELGLSPSGRVVLFSASSVCQERKGSAFLKEALSRTRESLKGTTLLVVGEGAEAFRWDGPLPVKAIGPVEDDRRLAAVYSAADLFILPTLADNLPNGALESLACGTPVVSFAVGGVPEVVRHMETGYAAVPRDAADLGKGIRLLLDDTALRERMARQGRAVVEQEYRLDLQTRRFEQLYRDILRNLS